jgi:hypothetical protein
VSVTVHGTEYTRQVQAGGVFSFDVLESELLADLDGKVEAVPIRLMQTPTTYRVGPSAGI